MYNHFSELNITDVEYGYLNPSPLTCFCLMAHVDGRPPPEIYNRFLEFHHYYESKSAIYELVKRDTINAMKEFRAEVVLGVAAGGADLSPWDILSETKRILGTKVIEDEANLFKTELVLISVETIKILSGTSEVEPSSAQAQMLGRIVKAININTNPFIV